MRSVIEWLVTKYERITLRLYVLYRFLVVALAYVFMLMQFVRKCGSVSSAKSLVWLLTPLPYKENGNKDKRKFSLRVLSYVENAFECLVVES